MLSGGAYIAALLVALLFVVIVATPHKPPPWPRPKPKPPSSSHGIRTTHRPHSKPKPPNGDHITIIYKPEINLPHKKPSHHKPSHHKPFHNKPSNHKPRQNHHKLMKLDIGGTTKPHSGFALIGNLYHKGKLVSCPWRQTLVCEEHGCKIPTCEEVKMNDRIDNPCRSGEDVAFCTSPLFCDCDNNLGYVRVSTKNHTCVREGECFNPGVVQSIIRCDYVGCNDNLKCADAWTTNQCNSTHKLAQCREQDKKKRCPLHYYWNDKNECVAQEHCIDCPKYEVPICPSTGSGCEEPTCQNVRDIRKNNHPCDREHFPECKQKPVCTCRDFHVRLPNGDCDFEADCVKCGPNEYPYCPTDPEKCKERTEDDIDHDRDPVPSCPPLGDDPCNVEPKCHCMYPYIRNKNKTCVLPTRIFTQCQKDDFTSTVCLTNTCSLRHCANPDPENLCTGLLDGLYNCTKSKISCQCKKGDFEYNVDEKTPGSRETCATAQGCVAMGRGLRR